MLLHSLLDGHSQTLTLPGLYPIGIYSGWRRFVAELSHPLTVEDVVEFVMDWLAALHDTGRLERAWGLTELGEGRDEHCSVSRGDLHACLVSVLDELGLNNVLATVADPRAIARRARKFAVLAGYLAYARALGLDTRGRDVLVYPAHGSEIQDLRDLAEDFADLSVIHMIRDPVDGLFSTIKYNASWQARFSNLFLLDPFRCAIMQMTRDSTPMYPRIEPFHALRPYSPALASRSRAIRLEDLHRAPESTMRTVAQWIGLPWEPVLLESTFAGKKWWNRPGLRRVSGFKPGMSTTEGVSALDRLRIAAVTAPIRRRYGYEESRPGAWLIQLFGLLALAAPFRAERQASDPVREYALFVTRGPLSLVPRARVARQSLLLDLVEARTSTATIRRIERWCALAYGKAYTYGANRLALLSGLRHLRRQADWVELLAPQGRR